MAVDSFARLLAMKALKSGGGSGGSSGADGVGVASSVVNYAISTSGTQTPTTGWGASIPSISQGQYFWTRVVINYTDGTDTTFYSVAYEGKDGENGEDAPVISSVETEEVTNADGYTTNSLNLVLSDGTKVPFNVKVKDGGGGSGGGDGAVFVAVSGIGSNLKVSQENYDLLIQSPLNGLVWLNRYYNLGVIASTDKSRTYFTALNASSGTSLDFLTVTADLKVTRSLIYLSTDTYTLITSPVSDDTYSTLRDNTHAQVEYDGGYYQKAKTSKFVKYLHFQGGIIDNESKEWIPQTLIIDGTTKEITVIPNTSGKIEFIGGMLPESFEVGKIISVNKNWLTSITGGRTSIYKGELVLSKYNYLLISDSTQEVTGFGSVKLRMLKSFVPNTKEVKVPISAVVKDETTGLWSIKIKDADIEPNVYVRIYPADEVTTRILSSTLVSTICGYYIDTPATDETEAVYGVEIALTKQPYNTLSFYYELRGVTPNGN